MTCAYQIALQYTVPLYSFALELSVRLVWLLPFFYSWPDFKYSIHPLRL